MFFGINKTRLSNLDEIFTLGQRGASGVLPLIFSTIGGGAFLFTFYNLTQYTAARSAADQAARHAARCLSPSDAECKDINPNGTNNTGTIQNWYGFNPATGPTTVQFDTYTYNAQVFASNYGAQYNSYEVLTGNPIILHQETEIKPMRFLGLLNSYQRLRADVTIYVSKNGVQKSCRVKEAVQLPAGVDFNSQQTYFDDRWCGELSNVFTAAASDPTCSDVDPTWALTPDPGRNNSFCGLTLPTPRVPGELPWLQLGGDPICDGEPEAPFAEIPQTLADLINGFQSPSVPGTRGRAYPVTGARQFVVVEVYSCNPGAFKSSLENRIRNKDDLVNFFTSYPRIDVDGFIGNPDFDSSGGTSSFVYAGAQNVSFLAPQNWTYFEWSRQADGLRHLERRVCNWVTYDEAKILYPEFTNGNTSTYVSGAQFGSEIQTVKVYDAPSCLPQVKQDLRYNCPNRTIVGQSGALNDCNGWTSEQMSLENLYKTNAEAAIALNSNQSWLNFENLKTNFEYEIEPRFSPNVGSELWEFSWSSTDFRGTPIYNPTAVRDYRGYNPKILPSNLSVNAYERTDGNIDPMLRERLLGAISEYEGQSIDQRLNIEPIRAGEARTIDLSGVWPLIKDGNSQAVPTARPYINPNVNGSGFDFDLNCSPDDVCQSGNNYNSMEDFLRNISNSLISEIDLNDTGYRFNYQEILAGPQFLDVNSTQGLPACTQFRTLCQAGLSSGAPISLGQSQVIPQSCLDGTYVNCYPEYLSNQIATAQYETVIKHEIARAKALGEVRRINPQAILCDDITQANCVTVDIQENNSEIQVAVQFSPTLTTPFKEILNQDTLTVSGIKREIIETARLRNNSGNNSGEN